MKFNLLSLQNAIETNFAIENSYNYSEVSYYHKWSKTLINYKLEDLVLPSHLYFSGKLRPNFEKAIAVGGTRSPSVEAFCLCSNVVSAFRGINIAVISGGVPGIDLAAHISAVGSGLLTYAVTIGKVNEGFKGHEWQNSFFENVIANNGGFISEYDDTKKFDSKIARERLLARDRIISGMSNIFLAFECNENSATVDTAKRAYLQGKKVICIDTKSKTSRRGIEQIESEIKCKLYSNSKLSAKQIVEKIIIEI